jgi:hypothetical protein
MKLRSLNLRSLNMRSIFMLRYLTLVLITGLVCSVSGPMPAAAQAAPPEPAIQAGFDCSADPITAALIDQVTANTWTDWISRFSGVTPVWYNNQWQKINSRHSVSLFAAGPTPNITFPYLRSLLLDWYPAAWLEEDSYAYSTYTWKNLILTIPGKTTPAEVVIMSAHLDDMPFEGAAPGADDNGSGVAALLEAARIMQHTRFDRTIRLIWFTGEEQGLVGSGMYVNDDDHDLTGVVGVINLDMYAYDGNNDHCFEIHAGTLPASQAVGQCVVDSIGAYNLNLTYDFLNNNSATNRSDHASFWGKQIGAVEILEDYFVSSPLTGCKAPSGDGNPYYHSSNDTLEHINTVTGLAITKAALAAGLAMAGPQPVVYRYYPILIRK